MYLYTIYWDMMRYGIMGFERKPVGLLGSKTFEQWGCQLTNRHECV